MSKKVLTVNGDGVEDNSLGEGPDITSMLILSNENLLISGAYDAPLPERSIPFELLLSRDPLNGDFVLTVSETLTNLSYRIESSDNLQTWSEVVGSERAGNCGAQVWNFPQGGTRLFWRAVEF